MTGGLSNSTVRRGDPDFTSELSEGDFDPPLNRVRVLTVIGMIFGMLGLLSIPLGLAYFHQGSILGDLEVRLHDEALRSPSIDAVWFFISVLVGTTLSAILFIASLAASRFMAAGRIGLLFFACASLLFPYIGWIFLARWLIPASAVHTGQVRGTVPSYAIVVASIVGVLVSAAILMALTRPNVTKAFSSKGE